MCSFLRIVSAVVLCSLVFADARQESKWSAKGYSKKSVEDAESARADEDSWWPSAEFAVIQKVYDDCSSQPDLTVCLKSKALNALGRAIDQDSIQLADGLVLVKQNGSQVTPNVDGRALSGLTPEDRVDAQLKNKFQQLFDTHTLTMDLANEARGKSKKVLPYLLLGIFTTVSIVGGIALKTLAAIAGKALIASKVALTIAGIIALKKLFSHDGGHGDTTFQVHAEGQHRRNYYVMRPNKAAAPAGADPYRYYFDQSMPATTA